MSPWDPMWWMIFFKIGKNACILQAHSSVQRVFWHVNDRLIDWLVRCFQKFPAKKATEHLLIPWTPHFSTSIHYNKSKNKIFSIAQSKCQKKKYEEGKEITTFECNEEKSRREKQEKVRMFRQKNLFLPLFFQTKLQPKTQSPRPLTFPGKYLEKNKTNKTARDNLSDTSRTNLYPQNKALSTERTSLSTEQIYVHRTKPCPQNKALSTEQSPVHRTKLCPQNKALSIEQSSVHRKRHLCP